MEGSSSPFISLFLNEILIKYYFNCFFTPHKTPHVKNQVSGRGYADCHKQTQLIGQMFDLNVEAHLPVDRSAGG